MSKISALFIDSYKELKNLRSLTMAALLAAIYAVSYSPFAGNIVIMPGVIEIRLGFIAIAAAAMLFGPVTAPIVAIVGDIVGTIIFYGGSFFLGYTFSWFLQGVVFGLFFYKMKNSIPRICLSMAFNTFVVSLLLTTKWQEMMGFGPFAERFFVRLPLSLTLLPINAILLYLVLRTLAFAHKKITAGQGRF